MKSTTPKVILETLARARSARRAGEILSRAGEHEEAELSFERARNAYALLVGDESADALALDVLDSRAERMAHGTEGFRRRRAMRAVSFGMLVLGTFGYVAFALGARPFARVRGSGMFDDNPLFAPSMAVDGQVETEWLLPAFSPGTLDLTVFPPRDVHRVLVRNGHNRHFRDRAVRRYEVQLFRHGVRVRVVAGMFPTLTAPGAVQSLRMHPVVRDVDHVRFVVYEYHGFGGALSELELR